MKSDFQSVRQRLLDEIAQLDAALQEAHSSAATVVLDQTSVGRVSRMDAMQQQAMAQVLLERMQVSRRRLQAAVDRIDAGRYAICCQCEQALDAEQLERDPAAVFCRACIAERNTPA